MERAIRTATMAACHLPEVTQELSRCTRERFCVQVLKCSTTIIEINRESEKAFLRSSPTRFRWAENFLSTVLALERCALRGERSSKVRVRFPLLLLARAPTNVMFRHSRIAETVWNYLQQIGYNSDSLA